MGMVTPTLWSCMVGIILHAYNLWGHVKGNCSTFAIIYLAPLCVESNKMTTAISLPPNITTIPSNRTCWCQRSHGDHCAVHCYSHHVIIEIATSAHFSQEKTNYFFRRSEYKKDTTDDCILQSGVNQIKHQLIAGRGVPPTQPNINPFWYAAGRSKKIY